jgi:hypothetical protein
LGTVIQVPVLSCPSAELEEHWVFICFPGYDDSGLQSVAIVSSDLDQITTIHSKLFLIEVVPKTENIQKLRVCVCTGEAEHFGGDQGSCPQKV